MSYPWTRNQVQQPLINCATNTLYCTLSPQCFPPNSPCQLHVSWKYHDTLGMYGTQVGVFHQTDEVGLSRPMEGQDGTSLDPIPMDSHWSTSQTIHRKAILGINSSMDFWSLWISCKALVPGLYLLLLDLPTFVLPSWGWEGWGMV